MNEKDFEERIWVLKDRGLPMCPRNLEANVLRSIRLIQDGNEGNIWNWIGSLIPKSSFVMATLALVIATSSMATLATAAFASKSNRNVEVRRALGFNFITETKLVELDNHLFDHD